MNLVRGLLLPLTFTLALLPAFADAAVIAQQPTATTSSSYGSSEGFVQRLGTGLSGTVSFVALQMASTTSSTAPSVKIICWTSAAYSTTCGSGGFTLQGSGLSSTTRSSVGSIPTVVAFVPHQYVNDVGGVANSLVVLDPTRYYTIQVITGNNVKYYGAGTDSWPYGTLTTDGSHLNGMGSLYFVIASGSTTLSSLVSTNDTQISTVIPARDSTITGQTPLTVGATGVVNPNDWDSNTQIYIRWKQITGMGQRGNPSASSWGEASLPISVPGVFSVSGPSSGSYPSYAQASSTGIYQAAGEIRKPRYSLFGVAIPFFYVDMADITWQFTVGTSTASERAEAGLLFSSTGFTTTASSTANDTACHASVDFSITDCIGLLFVPSHEELQKDFDTFHDTFLVKQPIGYVTRFVAIMSGATTPVEPPALINYKFGSSSPAVLQALTANDPVYFQPFDHLTELNEVRSDQGDNKSVWDVIDPFITLVVTFAVASVIIGDLIGLEFTLGGEGDAEESSAPQQDAHVQAYRAEMKHRKQIMTDDKTRREWEMFRNRKK